MSGARKLWLAICIVGVLVAVAAVVLAVGWNSDNTNPPSVIADRDSSSPQYPENLVVDEDDESGTVVTAKALMAAPGAIVCADYEAVGVVFDLYSNSWTERAQDSFSHGQSKLLRGEPAPEPDPVSYGCALIPPGTTMRFHAGSVVPVVTVKMRDGKTIRGVTLQEMIASQAETQGAAAETQAAAAAERFRTTIVNMRPEFQRQFPTLSRSAPNLRWFQSSDLWIAVMPFGPCAVLQRADSRYLVREVDRSGSLGSFGTRDEAEQQAVKFCAYYYQGMQQDPNARMGPLSPAERVIWFSPESVNSSPAASSETTAPVNGEGQQGPTDASSANSNPIGSAGHP